MTLAAASQCLQCKHFQHAPAEVEAAFPGLSSLSSAYAAVRCDDGICAVHERYVAASSTCSAFAGLTFAKLSPAKPKLAQAALA
jgi:hypothetical protein